MEETNPSLQADDGEALSGGQVTVFDESVNAFGFQAPGLEGQDELLFFVGNSFFNQNWVSSPASTTARDGLGPLFNARSCASCHFKDGRGHAPLFDGDKSHGLLLRLSVPGVAGNGGIVGDPNYGDQLQDQAIGGVNPEGTFTVTYEEVFGEFGDGTTFSLRKPTYHIGDLAYGPLDPQLKVSPRVGQQMIGLGLLEAIDKSQLIAWSDEFDNDNDGISGRPNYVWDEASQTTRIGRFGWKANQPSLLQQAAGAFLGDLGIASWLFPNQNCFTGEGCDTLPNGGMTEIDDDDLDKVVLYSSTLAVPARRDWANQDVLAGKLLFTELECSKCHISKVTTGTHPKIDALSNQEIRPYTDLLLHDMGDGLADNRADFLATGKEWRTPPLWGIGLIPIVNGHSFYLHDGRARNLEEAVLWHGGEAQKAQEAFIQLDNPQRENLLRFLNSL